MVSQEGSLSKSLCYWVEKWGLKSISGYVKGCQIWPALLASCWLQGKGCSWRLTVKTMKLWDQSELLITTCLVQSNCFPSDETNRPGPWLSFQAGNYSPCWSHVLAFVPKVWSSTVPAGWSLPWIWTVQGQKDRQRWWSVWSTGEGPPHHESLRERVAKMSSFISWCHSLEPVTSSWVW